MWGWRRPVGAAAAATVDPFDLGDETVSLNQVFAKGMIAVEIGFLVILALAGSLDDRVGWNRAPVLFQLLPFEHDVSAEQVDLIESCESNQVEKVRLPLDQSTCDLSLRDCFVEIKAPASIALRRVVLEEVLGAICREIQASTSEPLLEDLDRALAELRVDNEKPSLSFLKSSCPETILEVG